MNIIILEGIAASGKTTIEKKLLETLPNSKLISEAETLMGFIDNRSQEIAIKHLNKLLDSFETEKVENLLIDRFHFTHAFRTGSSLNDFSSIEQRLNSTGKALLVLLTIDDNSIKARIEETIRYRRGGWKKGAKGTIDEKVAYYTKQQQKLLEYKKITQLTTVTIDTSAKDWESCVESIVNKLEQEF